MRLWSLHPGYLDSKGLVALWREGLLARAVLTGKTKGYTHHPQLNRFKIQDHPLLFLDTYLNHVYNEACARGYNFNQEKIGVNCTTRQIPVTSGQLSYEFHHLQRKLQKRDHDTYLATKRLMDKKGSIQTNPVFKVIPGDIEPWEKVEK
ncbi:hypothetical protein DSECCO2_175810 [anaerobic digester metagenome]|nr:MAG: hypothetical protein CVV29_07165 [Methanobacteriales archaeon HGW-Methanobacteriales-2]